MNGAGDRGNLTFRNLSKKKDPAKEVERVHYRIPENHQDNVES